MYEWHTGKNDKQEHVVSERDETVLSKLVENTVWWQLTVQMIFLQHYMIYTVNHKKGGRTFVIITLENLDAFL